MILDGRNRGTWAQVVPYDVGPSQLFTLTTLCFSNAFQCPTVRAGLDVSVFSGNYPWPEFWQPADNLDVMFGSLF